MRLYFSNVKTGEPTRDFEAVRWDNARMPWPDDYVREPLPARSPLATFGEENPYPLGNLSLQRRPKRAPAE